MQTPLQKLEKVLENNKRYVTALNNRINLLSVEIKKIKQHNFVSDLLILSKYELELIEFENKLISVYDTVEHFEQRVQKEREHQQMLTYESTNAENWNLIKYKLENIKKLDIANAPKIDLLLAEIEKKNTKTQYELNLFYEAVCNEIATYVN